MDRDKIESALVEAVERLKSEGDTWQPGMEIAPVAYRRLTSWQNRSKTNNPSREWRVRDLAKGLSDHFNGGPGWFPHAPQEYERLARELLHIFIQYEIDTAPEADSSIGF